VQADSASMIWFQRSGESDTFPAVNAPTTWPTGCFPDWWENMVIATAESTQTPVAMAATFSLAIVSAALGGKAHVTAGSFRCPVHVWTLAVSPSGAGKSPVYRALVAPLQEVVRRSQEQIDEPIRTLEYWDAVEGNGPRVDSAADAAARLRAWQQAHHNEEPVQFIFDDVTVDALLVEMSKQRMGIAQLSAESGWTELGKRGYRVLNHLNLCWDGEAISGSRLGRRHPRIEHPALTCGLFAQRQPWFDLLKQRAAVSSGYLPRFLVADVPSSRRRAPFKAIPAKVCEAWNDGVYTLLAADHGIVLSLTKDAARQNSNSFNESQALRESLSPDDPLGYWLEKAPQNVLRVAALLHLAGDDESNKVSADEMSRARAIVRVLIEQTRQLVKNEPGAAKSKGSHALSAPSVLDRATTLFGGEKFKVSDLAERMGRVARGKTDQVKRHLDSLVAAGAVQRFPRRSTGGRSEGPFYLVRKKKSQDLESTAEMASSADAARSGESDAGATERSAARGGLYVTDSSDGSGRWLDISALADEETISIAQLRARLTTAGGAKQE
jgi:replicative DNA helicase